MKSFGNIFSDSINEFGNKLNSFLFSFLFLYFIPFLVIVVVIILAGLTFMSFEDFDLVSLSSVGLPAVLFILASIIFIFIFQISLIEISLSKKTERNFKEIFSKSISLFWPFLGFFVVTVIFVGFLFLFLIIPGIIFSVYWIFAAFIFFEERKGIIYSLKKSSNLVKNRWWRTFGFFALIFIIS